LESVIIIIIIITITVSGNQLNCTAGKGKEWSQQQGTMSGEGRVSYKEIGS
jgi:hypothetical protein